MIVMAERTGFPHGHMSEGLEIVHYVNVIMSAQLEHARLRYNFLISSGSVNS